MNSVRNIKLYASISLHPHSSCYCYQTFYFLHILLMSLNKFSNAALTNYYTSSGLKQCKCIFLQLWMSEVQIHLQAYVPSGDARENFCLAFSRL